MAGVYNLLLLPAALLLFIWSTAANEFELYLWDTAKCQPTQNTFKHKLRIHSVTLCDITIQIICKATTVTHTKRIYRNLLRKETSFVYYTSSVLRKSRIIARRWEQN